MSKDGFDCNIMDRVFVANILECQGEIASCLKRLFKEKYDIQNLIQDNLKDILI